MHIPEATITARITAQLSQFPDLEISQVRAVSQAGGSPGIVLKVSGFDKDQNEQSLILKRQDNDAAYRLYQHYLVPYHLNSPQEYGYIELDGQLFLVMDYIKHIPANWEDGKNYLLAVKWLLKKDLITCQNLDSIRNLDCLGKMEYYGVDYWLPEFEKWYKGSSSNPQAKEVWRRVNANRNRINECIGELDEVGAQTVVHGDLQMSNILFGEDESNHEFFVIDWTQPHISSVTKDLASLYDNAPDDVKGELIETYRKQIDFHQFDEVFAKAKMLRDIGYLCWMVWMINEGQKEEIAQNELDRVATNLVMSLDEGW
jgi:aminoglycoside phosphotransferase (APT) family kinase protein